jgi:hypothetical protein
LGEVTGNGGTPTVFNTAAQNVIDFSFSDIGDITKRDPVSGHIKIDVKSFASDVNPAITVRDTGGTPVFTVDQNGNLWVKGTTTQENVVQVNSSETITDNLTAGDASGDSHLIKGNWSHNVGASTKFYVDGATGRVGIGGFDSVGYSLYVTGKTRVSDDIEPAVDGGANLGSVGKRWGNLYVINLSFAGDFLPQTRTCSVGNTDIFRKRLESATGTTRRLQRSTLTKTPPPQAAFDLIAPTRRGSLSRFLTTEVRSRSRRARAKT